MVDQPHGRGEAQEGVGACGTISLWEGDFLCFSMIKVS